MFLSLLNEQEKQHFLAFAAAVIEADGLVENIEQDALKLYAYEMHTPELDTEVERNVDAEIAYFVENATEVVRRAVFVELLALAHKKGSLYEEERTVITRIAKGFGLDTKEIDRAISMKEAYMATYKLLLNFINE